jgi:hypothetical protein
MKNRFQTSRLFLIFAVVVLGVFGGNAARGQTLTQTFALRAGWNSIWLEVDPTNNAIGAVFAGAPLVSVWTFADRITAVDFIADANEPVWNRDRWLRYLPPGHPAAFQNNLFAAPGYRAYLVQLTNAFTLNVTGRFAWRPRPWAPNAYNLRGFPIDPAQRPTFLDFFRPSSAHYDPAVGRLQKIYRLAGTGQWTLVQPSDRMTEGEAYWCFANGGSDYAAPIKIKLDGGDGLDFGSSLDNANLVCRNLRETDVTVSIRDLTAPSPLSYQRFNSTNASDWVKLDGAWTSPTPAGGEANFTTSIRRRDIAGDRYGSVLVITDGAGTRLQLPVSARKLTVAAGGAPAPSGAHSLAGLWVGQAAVNAVNEVNSATDVTSATATSGEFRLRLLIHVSRDGSARLLKEVVQLWKDGTTTNTPSGQTAVAIPGRYALVTESSLYSQFGGAILRDGTPGGQRFTAVGYDFPTTSGANFLPLTGTFGGAGTLSGTISLSSQFPTNPFRHKFHPDHDNLDDRFVGQREEAFPVQRTISLQFASTAPAGENDPDFGYRVQAGTYRETVTGLNKTPIRCQGTFRLTRVSDVAELNR